MSIDHNHYREYVCNIQCPKLKARQLRLTEYVSIAGDLSTANISCANLNATNTIQSTSLTASGQVEAGSMVVKGTSHLEGATTVEGVLHAKGDTTVEGILTANGNFVTKGDVLLDASSKSIQLFNPAVSIYPSVVGTSQDTRLQIYRDALANPDNQSISVGVETNIGSSHEARISSHRNGSAFPIPIVMTIDEDPVLLLNSDKLYTDNLIETGNIFYGPYIDQTNPPVMALRLGGSYLIPRDVWEEIKFAQIEPNLDTNSVIIGTTFYNEKLQLTFNRDRNDFQNMSTTRTRVYKVNTTVLYSQNNVHDRGLQVSTFLPNGQLAFTQAIQVVKSTNLTTTAIHCSTIVKVLPLGFLKIFGFSNHNVADVSVLRVSDAQTTYCQITLG